MLAVIGEFLSTNERPFSYTDKGTGERVSATERQVKVFDSERDDVLVVSLSRDFQNSWLDGFQRGDLIALAVFAKGGGQRVYMTATHLLPELVGKSVKAA